MTTTESTPCVCLCVLCLLTCCQLPPSHQLFFVFLRCTLIMFMQWWCPTSPHSPLCVCEVLFLIHTNPITAVCFWSSQSPFLCFVSVFAFITPSWPRNRSCVNCDDDHYFLSALVPVVRQAGSKDALTYATVHSDPSSALTTRPSARPSAGRISFEVWKREKERRKGSSGHIEYLCILYRLNHTDQIGSKREMEV